MTVSSPKTYTAEEYLASELESDLRHEFRNGEIIEMTGGTPAHNEINGNLLMLLKLALRGQPYWVFVTDQRLWLPECNLYTYPDVMVAAKPLQLQEGRTDTVMNAIFVAEVLSKSTRSYDLDEKFAAYRTIPTFQEYLLIDQYSPQVSHYTKQRDNQWLFTDYAGMEGNLHCSSVAVEIPLAELYGNVEF
ncbi:Uma2 family endonuclease [Acaryochloris marina NIES-2412]|uniref:Uma2 family endonuclease n=1 Tax=Acaryochloris marina TaxID=155978 RepID=UPI00405A264D